MLDSNQASNNKLIVHGMEAAGNQQGWKSEVCAEGLGMWWKGGTRFCLFVCAGAFPLLFSGFTAAENLRQIGNFDADVQKVTRVLSVCRW